MTKEIKDILEELVYKIVSLEEEVDEIKGNTSGRFRGWREDWRDKLNDLIKQSK